MSGRSLQVLDQLSPGRDIQGYLRKISQIPVLSAERESELAWSLYRDNDVGAAKELVLSQLRFVVYIARGYSGYGMPLADLVQEGTIGLINAVRGFDPSRKVRLISYAVHWIKAQINEYILNNFRIVKVATTKAQRKLFFNLRSAKTSLTWFTQDEAKVVAKDLGVSVKDVKEMEQRMSVPDVQFDPAVDEDEDSSATFAPVDYLHQDGNDPAMLVEREDRKERMHAQLAVAMQELDERQRDIVQQRLLTDGKAVTLQRLATKYGVSPERIRQIEQSAVAVLRAEFVA